MLTILNIRSGINQNDASKYSIVKLYFEQADEQANEQADEHIITKLNLLFNYLINNDSGEKIGLEESDRSGLILILKRLELFLDNANAYKLMNKENLLDIKIMMWVIKDIYISPHKALLNNLKLKKLNFRYLKAKKYISKKEKYSLYDLINYFSVCLMDELEEGRIKQC